MDRCLNFAPVGFADNLRNSSMTRERNLFFFYFTYDAFLFITVVPILHLQLGSNMNPDDIEEDDDVYFECNINANPDAYKVVWKHNVS